MSDLISRQAAIDAIDRLDIPEDMCVFEILSHIELEIGNLPSAQPEQRKGEWIDEGFYADGHGAHAFRCSECGGHIIEYDADPFCRWCGADMRGEENATD